MTARVRASDAERDAAVTDLREHLVAGRLDLPEFVTRMERAQTSTYTDELPPLFDDLPDRGLQPAHPVAMRHRPPAAPWQRRRPFVPVLPLALLAIAVVIAAGPVLLVGLVMMAVWITAMTGRHWGHGACVARSSGRQLHR